MLENLHKNDDLGKMSERYFFMPIHAGLFDQIQITDQRQVIPAGTVISLINILRSSGVRVSDLLGLDQGMNTVETFKNELEIIIDKILSEKKKPVLMFTLLLYNSHAVFDLMKYLKEVYNNRIIIVLGGQLASMKQHQSIYKTMLAPPGEFGRHSASFDLLCLGYGESIIPQMIGYVGEEESYDSKGTIVSTTFSSGRVPSIVSEIGARNEGFHLRDNEEISQILFVGNGGPGCTDCRAKKKVCTFCALQNLTVVNHVDLYTVIDRVFNESARLGITNTYDVSNEFLPYCSTADNLGYLKKYLEIRNRLITVYSNGNSNFLPPSLYCYLSVRATQDLEVVKLIKEIGVDEAFLGIDHLSDDVLLAQQKGHTYEMVKKSLSNFNEIGIKIRVGIVIGAERESEKSIQELEDGLAEIVEKYRLFPDGKPMLEYIAIFSCKALLGSPAMNRVIKKMKNHQLPLGYQEDMEEIWNFFTNNGYLTSIQQSRMNHILLSSNTLEGEDVPGYMTKLSTMISKLNSMLKKMDINIYQE